MTKPQRPRPPLPAALTPEQKAQVDGWLKERWRVPAGCPVSGDANWVIADHLVQPMTFHQGAFVLGGGVNYPQVMLVCRTCGYTRFFNAVVMGLVPPGEVGEESKAQEAPDA